MNRYEHLGAPTVEAFIDWLRPHVRGDRPLQHAYTMRRPIRDWRCTSLWDAYTKYEWRNRCFETNREKLDHLAAKIRYTAARDDRRGFVEAACQILQWGGVMAWNAKVLCDLDGEALPTFCEASRLLDPLHADIPSERHPLQEFRVDEGLSAASFQRRHKTASPTLPFTTAPAAATTGCRRRAR